MSHHPPIIGVVVAGGKSSRMNGEEKSLLPLGDTPIISHVLRRLSPQVDQVIINANGDAGRFGFTGVSVVKDVIEGQQGPLAGIYTAMLWGREHVSPDALIACVPSDVPFFPSNLIERLENGRNADDADIAYAISSGRSHPIFNLLPVALHADLYEVLVLKKQRAIHRWIQEHKAVQICFEGADNDDAFFNINTQDDFRRAQEMLG